MGMAILFRRNADYSPFKDALLKLVQTSGSKLILSSGFIDYSISQYPLDIISEIVNSFPEGTEEGEVTIIAGHFDDQVHKETCKPTDLPFFGKLLGTTIKGRDLQSKEIYKYSPTIRTSEWEALYLGIEDEIRALYKVPKCKSLSYYAEEIEAMRDELVGAELHKVSNIRNIAEDYSVKTNCWYCNFYAFVWLLRQELSIAKPNIPVRVVFAKKDIEQFWHSKIALKITDDNSAIAGLIGSSNLTGAAVRENKKYFNYESDIYLWKNGEGIEIEQKDFEVITVATTGNSPNEEQLLNEIQNGITKYLDNSND